MTVCNRGWGMWHVAGKAGYAVCNCRLAPYGSTHLVPSLGHQELTYSICIYILLISYLSNLSVYLSRFKFPCGPPWHVTHVQFAIYHPVSSSKLPRGTKYTASSRRLVAMPFGFWIGNLHLCYHPIFQSTIDWLSRPVWKAYGESWWGIERVETITQLDYGLFAG